MKQEQYQILQIDINSKRDREKFYSLPFSISTLHEKWQPGLRIYYDHLLDPRKNPFWKEIDANFYVLLEGNIIKGRIGFLHPGYIKEIPEASVMIFPDFTDDHNIAKALFDVVEKTAEKTGAKKILGPFNPNIHYEVGIQVEGFDKQNAVFMGYQPPYYNDFFLQYGYRLLKDFSAWELYKDQFLEEGTLAGMEARVLRNKDIRIRGIDLKNFNRELLLFYKLYCGSFSDHWGFSAPGWEEFKFIAGDIKYILKSELALVAEYKGTPVGFVLSVPDLYSVINKKYKGKISLFSILSLLRKFKKIETVRVMISGILPEYRHLGIHIPLFRTIAKNIFELGYKGGEIAWVMNDNQPMNKILPLLGAKKVKRYRIYMKDLDQ